MTTKEDAVRATLSDRPAGIVNALPHNARDCFAGLWNGAMPSGYIGRNDHLYIGKAECEWDWRETWAALRDAGLIEFREEVVDAPGAVGGKMTKVHWDFTDKGREVRADDLKWFGELLTALHEDAAAKPT